MDLTSIFERRQNPARVFDGNRFDLHEQRQKTHWRFVRNSVNLQEHHTNNNKTRGSIIELTDHGISLENGMVRVIQSRMCSFTSVSRVKSIQRVPKWTQLMIKGMGKVFYFSHFKSTVNELKTERVLWA